MTPRPAVTAEELAHDIPYLAVKFTNRCTNVARLRRVQAYLVRQIQAVEAERSAQQAEEA